MPTQRHRADTRQGFKKNGGSKLGQRAVTPVLPLGAETAATPGAGRRVDGMNGARLLKILGGFVSQRLLRRLSPPKKRGGDINQRFSQAHARKSKAGGGLGKLDPGETSRAATIGSGRSYASISAASNSSKRPSEPSGSLMKASAVSVALTWPPRSHPFLFFLARELDLPMFVSRTSRAPEFEGALAKLPAQERTARDLCDVARGVCSERRGERNDLIVRRGAFLKFFRRSLHFIDIWSQNQRDIFPKSPQSRNVTFSRSQATFVSLTRRCHFHFTRKTAMETQRETRLRCTSVRILQGNHLTRASTPFRDIQEDFPSAAFIARFRFGASREVIEARLLNVFHYLAEAETETRAVSAHLRLRPSWLRVQNNFRSGKTQRRCVSRHRDARAPVWRSRPVLRYPRLRVVYRECAWPR